MKVERGSKMIGILILSLTAGLALPEPQWPNFGPFIPTLNIQNCQLSQCNQVNVGGGRFPGLGAFPFGRRKRSLRALGFDGEIPFPLTPFSQFIDGVGRNFGQPLPLLPARHLAPISRLINGVGRNLRQPVLPFGFRIGSTF